jgi:ArpU family phage transcriptional regulator
MDWKKEAINDLMTYERKKESLTNIRLQIKAIDMQLTAVRGALSDGGPTGGGNSNYEERLLNGIVKRDRLKLTYRATKQIVDLIEKGLAGLDERDRLVLDQFYIYNAKVDVESLIREIGYERSQIYRIRNDALYKFTTSIYGICEY